MSTEINIKKRIDIQEEGVSITPDVNSINFTGDGVTASAIGDDVTVNIPGGMGTTTYYLNESVTQAPYKEFTSTLTASPEQTIVTSVASGATVTIQSFQTPSGVPGTTNIPGGRWAFYLHFSGTTGDSWDVFADVYKRDLGGIETLLLTTDAVPTSTLTGAAVMLLTDGVFPASTVLTTDRIVVKVRVTNTDSNTNSITFHTEGNTNYSVATTTLNQVVPTGAVTSVTGTAPIASSGGTTPAISMAQANGTTDGYLDSADWTTFNNKPDNLSQLNDVDLITTPPTDGEVLTYDSVLGLWKNEPININPTNQVVLFADLGTTEALKACTYNNGTLGVGATLTGNANGQLSTVSFTDRIDNVVTALNQIILVRAQSSQLQNGIYVVTQLGGPSQPFIITRAIDADTQAELYPLQINVFGGATQANLAYLQKTVDPIVGTSNIVFTTTVIGIQNTPVLHLDTATSAALPTCTYTSGTNPTLPGLGAFLEADVNGILPAINGVTLTAGRRFLVKDQVNQAHNGAYTVSSVGSASSKWRLTRVDAWGSNFTVLDREWKVNNPASAKYGARYSTNLLSLANTAIGTTNIVFTELVDINTNIYNADGTLAGNRTVTMAGNTLNLSGGNVGINTTPTQLLDVNGVTRHRGNVNMDNGAGIVWNDLTGIFPTSVNSRISWQLNSDRAEIYAWQPSSNDIDFVFKLRDDVTTTTDNYVFWMQDFNGEADDRYPLEMSGPAFIVNPLRRYATLPANANSGNTDFYVLKLNATGLTDSLIFGDVSATRVGINTSSPTETLDVNGKTKTTTFQLTTTPTAGYVLTSDASGNGAWQAASGGLTEFTEAENTAAPNATVPVNSLTPVTATTDADVAIVPKGTGAFMLDIPDNTATGGNKRGANAVDLQTVRNNAARVASGTNSVVLGGQSNTASNTNTIAGGNSSTASGSQSVALINGTASNTSSVAIGSNVTASGLSSIAIGSDNSVASNDYAVVLGYNHIASGQAGFCAGIGNVANGGRSTAMGSSSHVFGIFGRSSYASGQESTAGDSQASKFILRERTTGNTATTITTDSNTAGASNQVILSNQSAYRFKGSIVGKQSGSVNAAVWDIDGFIVRGANAAATTLNVSNVTLVQNTPAWGTPTLAADTTNGGLRVQVTGAAATNIQWTAAIETTEVIYA